MEEDVELELLPSAVLRYDEIEKVCGSLRRFVRSSSVVLFTLVLGVGVGADAVIAAVVEVIVGI